MASEFISDPDYKKIIKTRNLLNYKETFNTVSNIGVPLNDVVKSENNDNFITINQELSDNYSKKYRKRDILHNEYKFVRNNITKVYINIEQIFDDLNIYHIGVTFKSIIRKISFDIIGIRLYDTGFMRNKNRLKKTLFWDYSSKTIDEVIEYEKNLKYRYIIGIYDCRHYVRNLTAWACNNPTPVWKLDRLVKK
tara:strand:- start:2564 stop:3145 length:582 start_codon:yes stop_codon:yes gene_type:complete